VSKEFFRRYLLQYPLLRSYNEGNKRLELELEDTYRCSCGAFLILDVDIGQHFKMGHTLERVEAKMLVDIDIEWRRVKEESVE